MSTQSTPRQREDKELTEGEIAEIRSQFDVTCVVRPVPGFPGYAVSEDGRVFSSRPCRRDLQKYRQMRTTPAGGGYPMVRLQSGGKQSAANVHRLMAMVFLPPPSEGQTVVRHLDGNPQNNHVSNLAWGTHADNMEDMICHGRTRKHRKRHSSNLTENKVRLIRGLDAEGFAIDIIAHLFSIATATAKRVIARTAWGWVEDA